MRPSRAPVRIPRAARGEFRKHGHGRATGVLGSLRLPTLGAMLAVLACHACGDDAEPAAPSTLEVKPVDATPPKEAEPDAEPAFVMHPVQDGQTLWDIARAYELSIKQILAANEMTRADSRRLRKGAKLRIPGHSYLRDVETASDRAARRDALRAPEDGVHHFVSSGESLWTLARHYDVSVDDIMARNKLSDDSASRLREGQALVIPGVSKRKAARVKREVKRAARGIRHTLASGETIWDLARVFHVGAGEIMAANGLNEAQVKSLREGQKIFIPGVTQDKRGRVTRRKSARDRRADAVARRLGLGTRKVAKQLLRGRVKPHWMRAAGGKQLAGTLRWPVAKGWYVRGYGSGEGGYHLAVDIMGKIGWNVRAAAPGIVAYAGNEVRGYGNIVMVIHPGGWVTMYAHNSVNFVTAGEKVSRGTILAEVGSTGISRGPHVHFELMHRNKNCDPAPLFRPGIRHRKGRKSRVKKVTWRDPQDRPRAIRCHPRRRHPRSRWVVNEKPKG